MSAPARAFRIDGAWGAFESRRTDEPRSLAIVDGRIASIALRVDAPPHAERVDASGLWVLPGWIDIQLNDIEWLARGRQDPADHAARIRGVLAYQAARGVTGCVLATLAAPLEEIDAYLAGMRRVLDGTDANDGVLLGALVEGTFMNPAFHGAHNPEWVLPPSIAVFERLHASGALRLINVAPEASPEALEVIAHATRRGAIVGCGHAKPHAECVRAAIEAGLRYVIHLGNGPTGSHLKRFHDGGLLEETLRNDALIASIIVDGWHVHPQLIRDWIARKELSRVIAVSDAGFALGPPRSAFEVFGVRGEPAGEGAYLRVVPRDGAPPGNPLSSDAGALFGSAVGMREVFENLVNLLTTAMPGVYRRSHAAYDLASAVRSASRLCSTNPAMLLGLSDRGALVEGRRGDVILARIEGAPGEYRVAVERVLTGS